MSRERLFRHDDLAAFDWQARARELDIDVETARVRYEIALRSAGGDVQCAESLYLRQLQALADARRAAPPPAAPGRLTRVLYEASPAKHWTSDELARLPPGKFTRVQIAPWIDHTRPAVGAAWRGRHKKLCSCSIYGGGGTERPGSLWN
jgi:hypothetical protein